LRSSNAAGEMTEKRGLVATKLAEERRRLVRAVELAGDGEVDDWDEPEMALWQTRTGRT
jgi:hypothetical protein